MVATRDPRGQLGPAQVTRSDTKMAELRDIMTNNLLVDIENPRLPEEHDSQFAAIRAMLGIEATKTLALAQAIATEGFSPFERLFVTPSSDSPNRFIVLEGNRRLTALKLLAEPKLGQDVLTPAQQKKVKAWSDDYRARGEVKTIECLIFAAREDASLWIERRHMGDQGGVGIVRWGATEAARFNARRRGKRSRELQVLDFVTTHAKLDDDTRGRIRNVSITNLKRLISDEAVRKAVGLEIAADGALTTRHSEEDTVKPLLRIISDLAHEKIKVKDIYTSSDRKKYLRKISAELPKAAPELPIPAPLATAAPAATSAKHSAIGARRNAVQRVRKALIPSSCAMNIKNPKLLQIYRELRTLDIVDYSNAAAVLFRVFVELSIDHYIEQNKLMPPSQADNCKLRDKLKKSADSLESSGKLLRDQAKAARAAAQDQQLLHTSVTTMHQYVHNKFFSPKPSDLRSSWDNLQPFLEAVWK
jgi:hypothetical protein